MGIVAAFIIIVTMVDAESKLMKRLQTNEEKIKILERKLKNEKF